MNWQFVTQTKLVKNIFYRVSTFKVYILLFLQKHGYMCSFALLLKLINKMLKITIEL